MTKNELLQWWFDEVTEKKEEIDKFDEMYNGSWYTVIGLCKEDHEKYKDYIKKELNEKNIGTPKKFHSFTGKEMNEKYNLTGDNRYQDNLDFIAFSLDGLNISKLAMYKLNSGARWFDDIVENNYRRENDFDD